MPISRIPPEPPTRPLEQEVPHAWRVSGDALASIDVGVVLAERYQLTELIGEGGMSRVFKAVDLPSKDSAGEPLIIAVKVLSEALTAAGRFAGLTAHVHRMQRLVHPNIVRLFGCERDNAVAFITMEFLPGASTYAMLRQRIVGSPVPLEGGKARRIIAAVANALEYAHSKGVVHGDLKPGNVIVTPEFECKLIDFGISGGVPRDARDGAAITLAVTPQYASPQLMAGEEPHPTDDVFGLGCVAYELLTGVHPFDGESGRGTFKLAPPQRPGLTPTEYAALLHALQGERDKRPQSVREFMAEFAPVLPLAPKSRWPLYLLVVCAAIAGVFLWSHHKNSPTPQVTKPAPTPAPVATAAPLANKVGAVIQDCPTCPPMTVLPSGFFRQGAEDGDRDALPLERPAHSVHINYLFAMSSVDITVDDFRRFVEASGRELKGCDTYDGDWRRRAAASWRDPGFAQTARHPVVCVSWNDATAYAKWLSSSTGHRYRLPSASEWEFAAREGGKATGSSDPASACANANVADRSAEHRYPGWNVFPCDDGYVYAAPVGSFGSNAFGLSDVIGNVMVWTQDCWLPDYSGAPVDGSARGEPNCSEHEIRGGSWFSPPSVVKASYRNHFGSDYRTSSVGIRLVREME